MLSGSRYGSYLRGLLCDLKQGDGEGISTYTSNDNPRTDNNSTHPSWLHLLEQGKDPLLTEGKANEPNPPTSIKSLTVLQDAQEEGKNPLFGLLSTLRMELRFNTEKATEVSLHSGSPGTLTAVLWITSPCSFWPRRNPTPHWLTSSCRSGGHNTACLTSLVPKAPRTTTEKGTFTFSFTNNQQKHKPDMVAYAHNLMLGRWGRRIACLRPFGSYKVGSRPAHLSGEPDLNIWWAPRQRLFHVWCSNWVPRSLSQ